MTSLDKPSRSVTRLTVEELGGHHGKDKHRKLVCTLAFGDVLIIRPQGTQRPKTIALTDVYSYAIRCEVNKAHMEKLREKKAKKQEARQRRASLRIIRGGRNES